MPESDGMADGPAVNFSLRSGGYKYRALRKGLSGWDVFAHQRCLVAVGYPLDQFGADGFFGAETDKALRKFQDDFGLTIDGIAGPVSQRILLVTIAKAVSEAYSLPVDLEMSQLEHECSYLPGNYTPPYEEAGKPPAEWKRDLGATMLHKTVTFENCGLAFDAPNRLDQLAAFLRTRHDLYWKNGQNRFVTTQQRAWELAVGAWNAPAWADKLARGETLKPEQKQHIEEYMEDCTLYVRDWTP